MKQTSSIRDFDWPLITLAFLIASLGVLEIYSAAGATQWEDAYLRQMFWVVVGLGLLWLSDNRGFSVHQR